MKAARKFDQWANPAHLAAGALDAMRLRHLTPVDRERMAYLAGDIDAANIWAQFIDTAAENETQQEELETLKDNAADLKADIENLETEIKTSTFYIEELESRIRTIEDELRQVSA